MMDKTAWYLGLRKEAGATGDALGKGIKSLRRFSSKSYFPGVPRPAVKKSPMEWTKADYAEAATKRVRDRALRDAEMAQWRGNGRPSDYRFQY